MGQEWLRRRAGVLMVPDFRRFYLGYVTSQLGTAMSPVALAWAVLDTGASATGLGLVFFAGVFPMVALIAVAGAIADRFGRRRVMLFADVLRCCAQGALAVTLFAGRPPLWLFVLLAALRGTGEACFAPALGALTAEIAPAGQLINANTLYGLAASAASIAGPSLGGVLVALTSPAMVVAADAASYAASVLALASVRLPAPRHASRKTTLAPSQSSGGRWLSADLAEGWREFRSRTWLLVITVQFAFFNLFTWAPWLLLGPVIGRQYLGGPAVWGAIMAAQGAGAVVAGVLLLGRAPRRPLVVATLGTFCYALPDIPMALHAGAPWVGLAAFACGAGSATFGALYSTTVQQQVPLDALARVNAFVTFPNYGIGVIGFAIDGPLAAAIGARTVFAAGAIYGLLSSAIALTLPAVRAVKSQNSENRAAAV